MREIRKDLMTEVNLDNPIDMNCIIEGLKKERFLFRIKFKEKSSLVCFFFREVEYYSDVEGNDYTYIVTPEENFVGMFEHVCSQIKHNHNDGVAYYVGEKYSHTFFVVFMEEDKKISLEENLDLFSQEMRKNYKDLSSRF